MENPRTRMPVRVQIRRRSRKFPGRTRLTTEILTTGEPGDCRGMRFLPTWMESAHRRFVLCRRRDVVNPGSRQVPALGIVPRGESVGRREANECGACPTSYVRASRVIKSLIRLANAAG